MGVQIWWSGAQNRSLLKLRGHIGLVQSVSMGGGEGGQLSPRTLCRWGTIYPRTKCPGDSFSENKMSGGQFTKFPETPVLHLCGSVATPTLHTQSNAVC